MTSAHIRTLLDRYGRYNQEPALFLQIVQALEEYFLLLVGQEQELAMGRAYDKTLALHLVELVRTDDVRHAFFVATCACGWTFKDSAVIGYNDDAVPGGIYVKHADHVRELVNAEFKEKWEAI